MKIAEQQIKAYKRLVSLGADDEIFEGLIDKDLLLKLKEIVMEENK